MPVFPKEFQNLIILVTMNDDITLLHTVREFSNTYVLIYSYIKLQLTGLGYA